jgi:hypothetical protein
MRRSLMSPDINIRWIVAVIYIGKKYLKPYSGLTGRLNKSHLLRRVLRKGHSGGKTVAVHCRFSLKRHLFRREIMHRPKQLTRQCAIKPQSSVYPILSQLIAALSPIDLRRALVKDAQR